MPAASHAPATLWQPWAAEANAETFGFAGIIAELHGYDMLRVDEAKRRFRFVDFAKMWRLRRAREYDFGFKRSKPRG